MEHLCHVRAGRLLRVRRSLSGTFFPLLRYGLHTLANVAQLGHKEQVAVLYLVVVFSIFRSYLRSFELWPACALRAYFCTKHPSSPARRTRFRFTVTTGMKVQFFHPQSQDAGHSCQVQKIANLHHPPRNRAQR